jgi:hypothetical protein
VDENDKKKEIKKEKDDANNKMENSLFLESGKGEWKRKDMSTKKINEKKR